MNRTELVFAPKALKPQPRKQRGQRDQSSSFRRGGLASERLSPNGCGGNEVGYRQIREAERFVHRLRVV